MIFAFSGKIGSGKTTFSKSFAEQINANYASFGDYVREIAKNEGLDVYDRSVLQQKGVELIQILGWDKFCASVLACFEGCRKGHIVIDGIRHVEAVDALKRIFFGEDVYLILLEISDDQAVKRQIARSGHVASFAELNHSTEQSYAKLKEVASLCLDSNRCVDENSKILYEWYEDLVLSNF